MKPHYYIALDLGQAQDYTALVVLERPASGGGCYQLRYLQRFRLGLPSQPHFRLGMNPGTPVSTTALNLTRDLIPSLISRMASSGNVETSKFSLIWLGIVEVVRRAVPRWMAQASKTSPGSC